MKKIIAFLLTFAAIAGVFIVVQNKDSYPTDLIYNYMESESLSKPIVNADDYVVAAGSSQKIIYNKKTKETVNLSQTVFDQQEMGLKLITAKGNTLYYIAIDVATGGSALYAFDLDTLEREKIDTKNPISNLDAFLGTEEILGIDNPGNDMFTIITAQIWLNKYGRHNNRSISDFLSDKDSLNEYGTKELHGICTTDDYIFFINELSTLYRYSYNDGSFKKLSDDRITDFFITEDKVYFYSADENEKLFMTNYDGTGKEYITDIEFTEVHIRHGKAYGLSENGEVYELDGKKCTVKMQDIEAIVWDTDGDNFYMFDTATKTVEVRS